MRYALIGALLLLACPALAAGHYHLSEIGLLPGAVGNYAWGINSRGQVVGATLAAAVGGVNIPSRAFLWNPHIANGTSGSVVEIGSTPGSGTTAINDLGQIVGWSGDLQAFLWTPTTPNGTTGTMVELGTLPGQLEAQPTAINSMGQVAGDGGLQASAFLWTPDAPNGSTGEMVDLGHIQGQRTSTYASGINARGQVVGTSYGTTIGPRPFLWTPATPNGDSGSMVDLGDLPDGLGSGSAHDINAMGQVVGQAVVMGPADVNRRAFLWTPDTPNGSSGAMVDLGALPDTTWTQAFGINSHGQVVGSSSNVPISDESHAFLWTPDVSNGATGKMVDLKALLAPEVADDWIFYYATAINDAGQIVGYGKFDPDGAGGSQGVTRAFLLTPVPEPATCIFSFCALAPWLAHRRRPVFKHRR
jgi:probable HAF family extracellular repeat protein